MLPRPYQLEPSAGLVALGLIRRYGACRRGLRFSPGVQHTARMMASNESTGDNHRIGAVKKRSHLLKGKMPRAKNKPKEQG